MRWAVRPRRPCCRLGVSPKRTSSYKERDGRLFQQKELQPGRRGFGQSPDTGEGRPLQCEFSLSSQLARFMSARDPNRAVWSRRAGWGPCGSGADSRGLCGELRVPAGVQRAGGAAARRPPEALPIRSGGLRPSAAWACGGPLPQTAPPGGSDPRTLSPPGPQGLSAAH